MKEFLLYSSLATIGMSGLLILTGIVLIKKGLKSTHKKAMLSASVFALIFVVLYLMRSSLFPPERYAGDHRTLFLFILWSHTVLAMINFPMAAYTIYLGFKERFTRHKRIAPYTAGVWIYVAVTGWAIFLFPR
ncbi:MAG: DUF420 domain-containing protein [Thermodesulfobacteriota bacterium]